MSDESSVDFEYYQKVLEIGNDRIRRTFGMIKEINALLYNAGRPQPVNVKAPGVDRRTVPDRRKTKQSTKRTRRKQ